NAELALAHEVGKVGTWSIHGERPIGYWSALTQQMLGLPGRSTSLEGFLTRVHEEDRAWLNDMLVRALAGKGALNAMFRLRSGDGSLRWLSAR
ncbi:PAS domain-containing protein, partial [Escherichia coli]|uniref:PAS domain-containing protein n=1 Tax=Escherichia coli TaxID=562 RepID=UPI0022F0CF4A